MSGCQGLGLGVTANEDGVSQGVMKLGCGDGCTTLETGARALQAGKLQSVRLHHAAAERRLGLRGGFPVARLIVI